MCVCVSVCLWLVRAAEARCCVEARAARLETVSEQAPKKKARETPFGLHFSLRRRAPRHPLPPPMQARALFTLRHPPPPTADRRGGRRASGSRLAVFATAPADGGLPSTSSLGAAASSAMPAAAVAALAAAGANGGNGKQWRERARAGLSRMRPATDHHSLRCLSLSSASRLDPPHPQVDIDAQARWWRWGWRERHVDGRHRRPCPFFLRRRRALGRLLPHRVRHP